jgi:hypothetical protein
MANLKKCRMLKRFVLILLVFAPLWLFSQELKTLVLDSSSIEGELIMVLEDPPKFPGGIDSLWRFLESNLDFEILNGTNKFGRIYILFIIDTTGSITSVQVNPDFAKRAWPIYDDKIDEEISRVLEIMPKWEPAKQRNKPIPVRFSLSFNIPYYTFKTKNLVNPTAERWQVDRVAEFRYKGRRKTDKAVQKFICHNITWPSQDDCVGTVYIRCLINREGKIAEETILKGLDACKGFNEEALRVVSLMPNWSPAYKDGKEVDSYVIIPVRFVLN